MKKAVSLCVAFLLLLSSQASLAWAVDFVHVDETDKVNVYFDAHSIELRDGYVVVWVQFVPKGIERTNGVVHTDLLVLFAFNVKYKQSQILEHAAYDYDGNVIELNRRPFSPNNYREVRPGTVADALYTACVGAYKQLGQQKQ